MIEERLSRKSNLIQQYFKNRHDNDQIDFREIDFCMYVRLGRIKIFWDSYETF